MSHDHDHGASNFNRAFAIGIGLNLAFVAVEATYGLIANSLALVADAGHNFSDVLGLVLAWIASRLVRRPLTARRSYGWRRSTVLAALANAVFLLIAIGAIAFEALRRFGDPAPVAGKTVIVVALIGIGINTLTALLFAAGRKGDLNIRGAFLHMAADAGVSAGVVIAGLIMLVTDWDWLDPVVSLLIAAVIFVGTWGLLRDSFNMALDAVPDDIDPALVTRGLLSVPGVAGVHDLHIWNMSTTEVALTAHLVVPNAENSDALLFLASQELHNRFEIQHVTLQIERGDPEYPCAAAEPGVL
ncbi:MAG: cation diffusion facilitator family transporter [Thermomicrobiales bacterium]